MRFAWMAGLALLAGVGTAPAKAQDGISPELAAYLEIAGGAFFAFDDLGGDDAVGIFAAAARANMSLRGTWNLQIDVQSLTFIELSDGFSASVAASYGHLYNRVGDNAFGVLGGVLFGGGTAGVFGAEAVHFGQRAIFTGQGLYSVQNSFGDTVQSVEGRLAMSYFLSENTSLYAEGLGTYYWFDDNSLAILSGILGVRHRYANLPISTFAQFRVDHLMSDNIMSTLTVGSAVVGISFLFGEHRTLRQLEEAVPMRVRWAPLALIAASG